jgi:hypothetical protein
MNKERIPKKILYSTIGGRRRVGKPRNRWIDVVEEDVKKLMGVRNWKRTAQDREGWRGQGPTSGCCAIEEEDGFEVLTAAVMKNSF